MKKFARSNQERTETTRNALIEAARVLFVRNGYAETSTPDICALAGITRGALYHHFADKRDLFRQVLLCEAQAVTAEILAATPAQLTPRDALIAGSEAYLDAMTVPGRTRLLLIEGPAVLGLAEVMAIDEANAANELREGILAAGIDAGGTSVDTLSKLLSAAFDRAALEIDSGSDQVEVRTAMLWLLQQTLSVSAKEASRKQRPTRGVMPKTSTAKFAR